MSKPKLPGTDLLNEAKDKFKKDGNMKKISIDWKIVKTVAVMFGLMVLFALGTVAGWNAKGWFNENVKSEVKSLSAVVSKE